MNCWKAAVVTQKPGGMGKPAWVISPRLAPLPPTWDKSVELMALKGRTRGGEGVMVSNTFGSGQYSVVSN